jgi:hypothetical protein
MPPPSIQERIGKFRGGSELMMAAGFDLQTASGGATASVFVLRGTAGSGHGNNKFASGTTTTTTTSSSGRPKKLQAEVEALLWRRKADLETALRALDAVADDEDDGADAGGAIGRVTGVVTANAGVGAQGGAGSPRKQGKHAAEKRRAQTEVDSFLKSCTEVQRLQLQMITNLFRFYDTHGQGFVAATDVRHAFRRMGTNCSEARVSKWIRDR